MLVSKTVNNKLSISKYLKLNPLQQKLGYLSTESKKFYIKGQAFVSSNWQNKT